MQQLQIHKGGDNLSRVLAFISSLSPSTAWVIEVKRFQRRRTCDQNAYLWGVVYRTICEHLEGWDADDVHEYCLGECFGWQKLEGFGRKRMRPLKRSSKLSTSEFAEYIDFIQRRMAEHGIFIADPHQEAA